MQSLTTFIASANPQSPIYYDQLAQVQQDRATQNLINWPFELTDTVLDIGSGNEYF